MKGETVPRGWPIGKKMMKPSVKHTPPWFRNYCNATGTRWVCSNTGQDAVVMNEPATEFCSSQQETDEGDIDLEIMTVCEW